MVADTQRFVDRVSLNTTSGAILSDQRDNLAEKPPSLATPPLATGGARNVWALLGFHEEAT